ncbi:ornithine cyclodeaminase family protein [Mesorhizobium sp. M00.F.Ca.ET.151.01.1.1]|nr:ornithine cyclodeaminase family protein [Mesorhizobium sp. M00.F.Ca.ET.151.01.1.1]
MSWPSAQTGSPAAELLIVDGPTVEALVSSQEAIGLAEAALRKTSNGIAHQDIRRTLDMPGMAGSCLSLMYASLSDQPHFGAKVLSVSPQNFEHGLPSHQGGVLLFEKENGRPVALINGHAITGLRTPAATAVATRTLSRPDSRELAVIGYGEQARRHIETIALVRPIARVRVWGRDPQRASIFAQAQSKEGFPTKAFQTAREAVTGADIVCTVTSAKFPVLHGEWLTPGTHVNAVGASVSALKELDTECVVRSKIWVDYLPMAMTSASDIIEPLSNGVIDESQLVGEIGAVLNGDADGRRDESEITLYRSLGVPAQDIELANFIYQKAKDLGLGTKVSL